MFDGDISVVVNNKIHLENLISKLSETEGVDNVERV